MQRVEVAQFRPSGSHDELRQAFNDAVRCAVFTGRLSPICADFDLALIYAIGSIARAARDGNRTDDLVREACRAFGQFAALHAGVDDDPPVFTTVEARAAAEWQERSDTA